MPNSVLSEHSSFLHAPCRLQPRWPVAAAPPASYDPFGTIKDDPFGGLSYDRTDDQSVGGWRRTAKVKRWSSLLAGGAGEPGTRPGPPASPGGLGPAECHQAGYRMSPDPAHPRARAGTDEGERAAGSPGRAARSLRIISPLRTPPSWPPQSRPAREALYCRLMRPLGIPYFGAPQGWLQPQARHSLARRLFSRSPHQPNGLVSPRLARAPRDRGGSPGRAGTGRQPRPAPYRPGPASPASTRPTARSVDQGSVQARA